MPGYVVDQAAAVTCMHQGTCQIQAPSPRVKVGGSPAVLKTSTLVVAGCTMPPPPGGNGPDVTGTWLTPAVRVKSSGLPLILADAQGLCVPTGLGVIVQRTQIRVKAV